MAVVSSNSEFIFADVGCQGRISDGGVLRNKVFYKALQSHKLQIPEPKPLPVTQSMIVEEWCPILPHFVGDDAFSLTPNLIKPCRNKGLTEEQRIFNYRLSRARRVSKNAFGILSSKFQVFHTTLCVKPENAFSLVHASLVLHNFLIKKYPSVYIPSGSLDYEKEDSEVVGGDWRQNENSNLETLVAPGMNHTRNASQVRNLFSEYDNGPGQVSWQWKVLLV